MLDSGFRISDLNNIPVNGKDGKFKNRIALDNTYLLSYAHTIYGINYNKQNYKIPLMSIRDDIKGYIGIESLDAPWSDQMKLWHGSWYNPSIRNRSYVYQWKTEDKLHEHYQPEKFTDKEHSYYIIKDAPFPFESGEKHNRDKGEQPSETLNDGSTISINLPIAESDPHPETNKIVTKSYIDARLAGERIVEVQPEFSIRDYECTYIIRSEVLQSYEQQNTDPLTIKIYYPKEFENNLCHNKIKFTILLEAQLKDNLYFSSLTKNPSWLFVDSKNNEIPIIWLNDVDNSVPNVTNELYYRNAQYLILRFESISDELKYDSIKSIIDGQEVVTGYDVFPEYGVFGLCENAVFRAIKECNNLDGQKLYIESTDETVRITSSKNLPEIHVDLEVPVYDVISPNDSVEVVTELNDIDKTFKLRVPRYTVGSNNDSVEVVTETNDLDKAFNLRVPRYDVKSSNKSIEVHKETDDLDITYDLNLNHPDLTDIEQGTTPQFYQKLFRQLSDGQIQLAKSYNSSYYYVNDRNSLNINFNASGLAGFETITTELLYKSSVDSTISGQLNAGNNIIWVSSTNDEIPVLKANRLYAIEFIYYPAMNWPTGNEELPPSIYARIKWFKQL